MKRPYFASFEDRKPPVFGKMSQRRHDLWHFLAGMTIAATVWYLHWRWTGSLNPDAMVFSVVVATAETLFFVGTLLFYHDIWAEKDTPNADCPVTRGDLKLEDAEGQITVDVFITTYDEDPDIGSVPTRGVRGCARSLWVISARSRSGGHRASS
jgi:cellulose synthase (UDP-forming)